MATRVHVATSGMPTYANQPDRVADAVARALAMALEGVVYESGIPQERHWIMSAVPFVVNGGIYATITTRVDDVEQGVKR